MKIYLACDHAGLEIKNTIKEFLNTFKNYKGFEYQIIDFGANIYNELDDYPDFIHEAGKALFNDNQNLQVEDYLQIKSFAFVFGGSGTGESIVMNRYKNVRCLEVYQGCGDNKNIKEIVALSRQHNNANAISFGARFVDVDSIKSLIEVFLNTDFLGERHIARINKIENTL